MPIRIKKTPTNNEYIKASGILVRNFTKNNIVPIGWSHMFSKNDYKIVLQNEEQNKKYPKISEEKISFKKMLVISDGYQFETKQEIIKDFPQDICILAVNGALKKWKVQRSINAYVVNNPYKESIQELPTSYFPTCIASIRTNQEFLKRYSGNKYIYVPTPERFFGTEYKEQYFLDDYRNPICACIGLAYQFGVEKLMFFCCDESFDKNLDGSILLKNGLRTYPHHIKSSEIMDANLYWLTNDESRTIDLANYSSGPELVNMQYITSEKAIEFFTEDKI